jgi:hypothetical protein
MAFLKRYANDLHQTLFQAVMQLVERELVPDFVTRVGIRYLLSIRLRDVRAVWPAKFEQVNWR